MSKQQGFTLIELMVSVGVVGILATIAVPSYQSFFVRGNRAVSEAFMVDAASREKQYLLDVRNYTSNLTTLYGGAVSAVPADVSKNYSISITVTAAPVAFLITATPVSTQQTADGALTLDSSGAKSPAGKW